MTPLSAFLQFILPAILAAGAIAALTLLSPRAGPDRDVPSRAPCARGLVAGALAPLLLALSFWPGDVALNQWHPLWPTDGTNRFLAVALGAGAFGLLHGAARSPLLPAFLRAALGAAVALALLSPLDERYMPPMLLVGLTLVTTVWLVGAGAALDHAAARAPRPAVPAALAATAGAGAPGLFASGYAGGAMLGGTLCAIGAGWFIAALLPRRALPRLAGAHTVWLALLAAVLLVTYGYVDVPAWWPLVAIATAPLGALAAALPLRPWARAGVALLTAGLVAGGASAGAMLSVPAETGDPYYGY